MCRWFIVAILIACPTLRESVAAEPVDPRRPPAITTQDVPPLPPEIVETLRPYQNIRSATFASWRRDGRGMLVLTRFGNTAQLHRVLEPGGRREQLTFFEEPVSFARHIEASPLDVTLLTMSRGGNENDQIYRFDLRQREVKLLTDGKSRNLLGPVMRGGHKMIVHSNARNGRDTDLYVVRTDTGEHELILETEGEFWQAEDWDRHEHRFVLLSRYVSINEGYAALLDLKTKQKIDIPLTDRVGQKVSLGEMRFAPDGKSAYFVHDAEDEFTQLYRFDLTTRRLERVTEKISNIAGIAVSPTSGDVAVNCDMNGRSEMYLLRGGASEPKLCHVPYGTIRHLEFSPDGKQLGFTLSLPRQPGEAYSLDVETGKLTRWTFSELGGLRESNLVEPKISPIPSFDGRSFSAMTYAPPGTNHRGPHPVVIIIHGGPESHSRYEFSALAQMYAAELRAAVIIPNVRGSSGYGKTFLQLDNGKLREDSVKDIGALLDWIAKQPELDAKRVAVVGGSYGGYMVLASLTHYGDRIRAGIDHVGIANWISFLEKTSPYRQDLRRAEYGDERDPEMRKFLERISPLTSADKIRSALLVAHGTNDPRVPFGEAQQIADKVRSLGRPVWTVYADNEGHGFAKKANRDYMQGVEFLFLQKYLAP